MKAKFVNESIGFKRGVDPKVSMGIGTSVIAERIKKARFAYPKNVEYIGFDQFEGRDIYIYRISESQNFIGPDPYYFVIPLSYDFIDDKETLSYFYAISLNSKSIAGANDRIGREVGEKYLSRKRKRIKESLDFERGKDPKSALGIGTSEVIYNRWDDLLDNKNIGAVTVEKSLNGVWHLVVYIGSTNRSRQKEAFGIIKKYFGDYISTFYNIKGDEMHLKISPEYVSAFIKAYNRRYPILTIREGIHFERSHSSADIRDKLIGTPFRPGRLFVTNVGHSGSTEAVVYLQDSADDPSRGIFHKIGVFFNNKITGEKSYGFYSPHLLNGSDKRMDLLKDYVRPLNKDEINLYLKRSNNPNPRFQEHLDGVKKLLGMYPII